MDVVLFYEQLGDISFEVKLSRRSLAAAHEAGQASLGWMRRACSSGTWSSSRHKVQSSWVGILALSPGRWQVSVYGQGGSAAHYCFSSDSEPPRASATR